MSHIYPLNPDHITIDGLKSTDAKLFNLNGIGIIPNEYLKGILTEVASILKNPNTILEFPPDANKDPVRTDAVSIHFDLHLPCRNFRECGGMKYCHDCDNLHASLFRGLKRENIFEQLEQRKNENTFKQKYIEMYGIEPSIVISRNRTKEENVFIEYDCPILGYRELLFPIIFEEKVLAVMFVGELVHDKQKDLIQNRREHFFKYHEEELEKLKNNKGNPLKIVERSDTKYRKDNKNVYTDSTYEELITKTQTQIERMVNRLIEAMEIKRKEFIGEKMDFYIRKLRNDVSQGFPFGDNGFSIFWQKVEEVLKILNNDFPTKHIVIYGTDKYSSDIYKELNVVASVGIDKDKLKQFHFNLSKMPPDVYNNITSSLDSLEIFSGIENDQLNVEEDLIRVFPSSPLSQCIFVIWVKYNRDIWDHLKKPVNMSDKAFDDSILSFYTIIAATFASIWASTSSHLMESVLKVFGHEMGQITPGLDAVRIRYFSPPATINKLTDNKIEDINCDLKGLLSQLYFIGGRAKQLITGSPDVNKTEFWAFKQLLYKWQNTFKPTTRGKRIKILVYDVRMDDPLRPMVYGDVYLLEQLLYNFISNAIKYAYRGTNILLDCMLNNEKTHHVLTVTNYGIDIGEDRKILDLFQRGKNVEGEEGLGIGLFLARKIAIAHGGDVDFERDLVSDYNVPLIQNYLTINKYSSVRWKVDESILESLKLIKQELEVTDKYWQIVSKNDGGTEYYKSTIGETIISLKKPTYKVTLKAYIPTKGLST